jgi:hypothetical protein
MSGPNTDGTFELDFSAFSKGFDQYCEEELKAAEKGMWEALRELKTDCDNVVPKTPHLEGNLRGDYTLVLEGITQSKVVNKSGGKGADHGAKGEKAVERYGALDIICKLIFRMPYAAKWHEAIDREWAQGGVKWSESGVGPKYVESKLMMFAKKYMSIVATRIKAVSEK